MRWFIQSSNSMKAVFCVEINEETKPFNRWEENDEK